MYLDGYRKEIVAWVREGLSDRAIAERVRVSPSTVRYWRGRNGVTRPPRGAKAEGPGPAVDAKCLKCGKPGAHEYVRVAEDRLEGPYCAKCAQTIGRR